MATTRQKRSPAARESVRGCRFRGAARVRDEVGGLGVGPHVERARPVERRFGSRCNGRRQRQTRRAQNAGSMNSLIEQNLAVFFPLFFAALWLTVTTVLAVLSGWFRLMARFPNQSAEPLLRVRGQSGSMGLGVSM